MVVGAQCRDALSGDTMDVYARVVINATGTLVDSVRKQVGATRGPSGFGVLQRAQAARSWLEASLRLEA